MTQEYRGWKKIIPGKPDTFPPIGQQVLAYRHKNEIDIEHRILCAGGGTCWFRNREMTFNPKYWLEIPNFVWMECKDCKTEEVGPWEELNQRWTEMGESNGDEFEVCKDCMQKRMDLALQETSGNA